MDCLSRALLVPWIMTYLNYCCDTTWTEAVLSYGLFYTCMKLGTLCGSCAQIDDVSSSKYALILIAMSYGGLAMTTKVSLLFLFGFIMGYSGALVSGTDTMFPSSRSKNRHIDLSSKLSAVAGATSVTSSGMPEIGNETNAQRRIIIFSFAVLFSGMIWREGEYVYNVSLKMPSLLMAGFCLLIAGIKFYVNKRKVKKPMVSFSSLAIQSTGKPSGSQHESSNDDVGLRSIQPMNTPIGDLEANLPSYTGPVPLGFLKLHKGNLPAAQRAYALTMKWREVNRVDDILTTPQSYFSDILKFYPHAIHGRSKDNCVVFYEILGKARPKELAKLPGESCH
jgi:hypothetical protein